MTEDLEAINLLSEQFAGAVKKAETYGTGDAIVIPAGVENQGLKILRMYENEARNAPDDIDVRAAVTVHLYDLAYMYYRAYNPILMTVNSSQTQQVDFLQKICKYANQSIQIIPTADSAFLLADVYRMQRFFGTAIHWYKQAERLASEENDTEATTQAKAKRLDLQSDGNTLDPPITRRTKFPLPGTPGLISVAPSIQTDFGFTQPPANPASAGPKNGYVGILAIVIFLVLGCIIFLLVNKGNSAGRNNAVASMESSDSTPANANMAPTQSSGVSADQDTLGGEGERYPQTRLTYLHNADIQDWDYAKVRYAQNEIYARHGYPFESRKAAPLRHQFLKFSWYHPVAGRKEADAEAQFTPIEHANQQLLAVQRDTLVREGKIIK